MELEDEYAEIVSAGLDAIDSGCLRSLTARTVERVSRARCILHPLGFYHIRIFDRTPVTIRLHYWPAGTRPVVTAVTLYHDHVWSLQSCVLVGRIENVLLTLERDDAGDYAMANIQQVGGTDIVVPTAGRMKILTEQVTAYSAGDYYSISPRVFHCSRVAIDTDTLTIVRAEVVVEGGPRPLIPAGYAGQAPIRPYLDESEARDVLHRIRSLVS